MRRSLLLGPCVPGVLPLRRGVRLPCGPAPPAPLQLLPSDHTPTSGRAAAFRGQTAKSGVTSSHLSLFSSELSSQIQLQNLKLLSDFFHDLERLGQFFLGVRCGDDCADARLAVWDGGVANALSEDAGLEKLARELVR